VRTRWIGRIALVLTAGVAASFGAAFAFSASPAGAGPPASATGSLSSSVAGALSTYTVDFTTVAANATTITLTGPAVTVFPARDANYSVNVNGGGATTPTSVTGGGTAAVTITPSASLPAVSSQFDL
jgi:hypothetical protein